MNPLNPKFPSATSHDFAKVPRIGINRSSFKCPSRLSLAFDAGKLIPLGEPIEVIPGDTWKIDGTYLCRLNTPIVPFYDNLYLDVHWFFVPTRLLWDNHKKFWGEKNSPGDSTSFTIPVVTGPAAGFLVETVYDYMGIPINKTKNVNALPLRAYNLIYRDFYKDQNIINTPVINTGDGPDTDTDYVIRRRNKEHDYFTSCLPNPQEGTAQSIALTGNATVTARTGLPTTQKMVVRKVSDDTGFDSNTLQGDTGGNLIDTGAVEVYIDPNGRYIADMSTVSSVNISALRQAIQLQAIQELNARGGHRYVEILYSNYGVINPAEAWRPEYLGGSTTPIYIVPVPQTSPTSGSDPQGQLAGYGASLTRNDGFTKSFTEHGYIIPIASVRASISYTQGLHRMWTRSTINDFFNPLLQNIGEQAVLTQEIFLHDADATADAVVFGYQERYAEYMYRNSYKTGKLRPAYATPLDFWHLSEEFGSAPTLSQTFIEVDPPIDRVVAVTTEPDFTMDCYFDAVAVRPMSMYSIPGLLTRL